MFDFLRAVFSENAAISYGSNIFVRHLGSRAIRGFFGPLSYVAQLKTTIIVLFSKRRIFCEKILNNIIMY